MCFRLRIQIYVFSQIWFSTRKENSNPGNVPVPVSRIKKSMIKIVFPFKFLLDIALIDKIKIGGFNVKKIWNREGYVGFPIGRAVEPQRWCHWNWQTMSVFSVAIRSQTSTFTEFWRMVDQTQSSLIVMLCKVGCSSLFFVTFDQSWERVFKITSRLASRVCASAFKRCCVLRYCVFFNKKILVISLSRHCVSRQ